MSAFPKPQQPALLDYGSTRSLQDGASYPSYGQNGPYVTTPLAAEPMANQANQVSSCIPYLPKYEYSGSYDEPRPPILDGEPRQPELSSYTPQKGCEGTRVFVQIQSQYDLHSSPYSRSQLIFGSKSCECIPQFLGFQGSVFQYSVSADAPPFSSTGSPSFAVPLQLTMSSQSGYPSVTLRAGIYTYERASIPSPSDDFRKRRISCSDNSIIHPIKKTAMVQPKEHQEGFSYRDNRAGSFSPYLQNIPAMNGFTASSYSAMPSPRPGPLQYNGLSATARSNLGSQSPITPSWSPPQAAAGSDTGSSSVPLAQGPIPQAPQSPARNSNPTLIRTSTLQANSVAPSQPFNPYAIYPSKAVLRLNGDLDTMTENWSREEIHSKRRLVQFTRLQNGSAIHADFRPVTPEDRAPNSICISCIYWARRKECFITSVDTIYLLESLVGVRFTVEEKNRIRRNLEGFRPLTVSKAKPESDDFFKVIMGFPAPKPRNIEKDVKVFPWKILSHALKKIIGKYSASYSSTAGALPTPVNSSYVGLGTGSDSGTEPPTGSPQSISDIAPSNGYGSSMPTPAYSHPDPSVSTVSAGLEFRTMLPTVSHPNAPALPSFTYPSTCHQQGQPGFSAPVNNAPWEMGSLVTSSVCGPPSNSSCYSYLEPTPFPLSDVSHVL